MLNLYECHFQYNDVYSRDYGLIIANIETSRFMPIVGAKKGEFLFNRKQKATELMGDNYEDTPLSIEIEIVTCNSDPLDLRTIREVERWLFQNSKFRPLFIDMDDDPYGETYELINGDFKRLYLNCRFMNPEKIESRGGIIGFKCTLETDSMMMWQEPQTYAFAIGDPIYTGTQSDSRQLHPLDIDGNGCIDVADAQTLLQVYTHQAVLGRPPEWIKENIIAPFLESQPNSKNSVDDAYKMCDFDYNADMYERDEDPNITVDAAAIALSIYVSHIVGERLGTFDKYDLTVIDSKVIEVTDPSTGEYLGAQIELDVDSDIDGYIYPEIEITMCSDGNGRAEVSIKNETDKCIDKNGDEYTPEFKLTTSNAGNMVILSSQTNYIEPVSYYNDITKHNFPRLVSGKNIITVSSNVRNISFTWQNRRFL